MKFTPDDKLKTAAKSYGAGYACSIAVFCAYAGDMRIDEVTACRMMEGFGGGMGGLREVCGALAAAAAIISFYSCDGTPQSEENRRITY